MRPAESPGPGGRARTRAPGVAFSRDSGRRRLGGVAGVDGGGASGAGALDPCLDDARSAAPTRRSDQAALPRERHEDGDAAPAAGRQSKRVRVQGHASARTVWGVTSYTREIATRPIRFTCAWCENTVTQQRFPGPLPAYCSKTCKKEAQRAQTRERVRRYRERQQ